MNCAVATVPGLPHWLPPLDPWGGIGGHPRGGLAGPCRRHPNAKHFHVEVLALGPRRAASRCVALLKRGPAGWSRPDGCALRHHPAFAPHLLDFPIPSIVPVDTHGLPHHPGGPCFAVAGCARQAIEVAHRVRVVMRAVWWFLLRGLCWGIRGLGWRLHDNLGAWDGCYLRDNVWWLLRRRLLSHHRDRGRSWLRCALRACGF